MTEASSERPERELRAECAAAAHSLRRLLNASSPPITAEDRRRVAYLEGAIAALEMIGGAARRDPNHRS